MAMGGIVSDYGEWTTVTWPWPQVRFVQNYVLGFAVHGGPGGDVYLFELACSSDVWTATYVDNLGSYATLEGVEVLGFGSFYVVSAYQSGNDVLVKSIHRIPGSPASTGDYPSTSAPVALTGCSFKGRAVLGGIYAVPTGWTDSGLGLGSIMWSGINSYEFRPRENRGAGYIVQAPWVTHSGGSILNVASLSKCVMVYGDAGACRLVPHTDPIPTFGMEDINIPGIRATSHIGGNNLLHCVIDREGYLWLITDKGEEKLGYKEYMKELLDDSDNTPVMISYVPQRRRFYIANGVKGFVLNEWGLYETNQLVTSAGDYRGILCGFFKDTEDYEWRMTVNTIDVGQRGMKTFGFMELGLNYYHVDGSDVFVSADYRHSFQAKRDAFTSLSWKTLGPDGFAYLGVTAPEVRLKLKGSDYRDAELNLDFIKTKVKMSDKRVIRGKYNE